MIDSRRAKKLGDVGEQMAAQEYVRRGYSVLERQFRVAGVGEADLILGRPGEIIVAEVKLRTGDTYGIPTEAITHLKRRRLRGVARYYLHKCNQDLKVRFDVVSITVHENRYIMEIIEEAFE